MINKNFKKSPLQTALLVRSAIDHLQIQRDAKNINVTPFGESLLFAMKNEFITPRTWITFNEDGVMLLAVCSIPILSWFQFLPWVKACPLKMKTGQYTLIFETEAINIEAGVEGEITHGACRIPSFGIAFPISEKTYQIIKQENRVGLSSFVYTSEGNIDINDTVTQYVPIHIRLKPGGKSPAAQ